MTEVVTVESFDPATGALVFSRPGSAASHSVVVRGAMRDAAMSLEAGEPIRLRYARAKAVAVERLPPVSG
jgi:hypothetical protein